MKRVLFFFFIVLPYFSIAQDTLVNLKGKKIACKIVKIENNFIYYQKAEGKKIKQIALTELRDYTGKHKKEETYEYKVNETLILPYKDNKVNYNKSFKFNTGAVAEKFTKIKKYIAEKEDSFTKTFKSENLQTGKILCKGSLKSNYETFFGPEKSEVTFSIIFTATEDEILIEFTDIFIKSNKGTALIEVWDSHSGEFFHSQLEVLDVQLKSILNNIEKKIKSY